MKKFTVVIVVALLLLLRIDAFAQESEAPTAIPTPVQYNLPYPGILPDHPLWFLKVVRDRIISFLIGDPLKKAEFNLMQADKRLNAGLTLFKRGKGELAVSTISKGENYFVASVSNVKEAKKMSKDVNSFLELLSSAAKKHQEVLREAINMRPEFKDKLELELRRMVEQEKIVIDLRSQ